MKTAAITILTAIALAGCSHGDHAAKDAVSRGEAGPGATAAGGGTTTTTATEQAKASEAVAGAITAPELKLDANGKKWTTDKSVRDSMHKIHMDYEKVAHSKKKPADTDFSKLSGKIKGEIGKLSTNASKKLAPEANTQFQTLVTRLDKAADGLRPEKAGDYKPDQAMNEIHTVLHQYTDYFEHPDFHKMGGGHH